MRSAAAWAKMFRKHIATLSQEELEAFVAAIQWDAIGSAGEEMGNAISRELERIRGMAGEYPEGLFK